MNYRSIFESYIKRYIRIMCQASSFSTNNKQRVVILGSGWASYSVLKTIDQNLFHVKVVSPRNHFLFTPLLCSTTVGTLEFRSITEPIRSIGFQDPHDYIQAFAEKVDIKNKILTCKSTHSELVFHLPFDKLIIGVGCLNNTFGVPGVDKYAFFLKEIADAQRIRTRILHNCEKAMTPSVEEPECERLLHTVIVGGGPTGVEFGAELYDFKKQDVKRLYKSGEDLFKVTLVEASHILSSFDNKLRRYAEKKLEERSNFKLLKSSVIEVKENSITLTDGTEIPCGLVVWSTGLSPQKFTEAFAVPKNEKGQILTDRFLRILGDPSGNIYAIGDCSQTETSQLPCTAQVAERQGRYLAKSLKYLTKGKTIEPFQFQSRGMLAYIGDYKALIDLKDMKTHGFSSWFLWRSAYLTRLGSWRLRLQVPVDWLKTLLFGRDTSNFR